MKRLQLKTTQTQKIQYIKQLELKMTPAQYDLKHKTKRSKHDPRRKTCHGTKLPKLSKQIFYVDIGICLLSRNVKILILWDGLRFGSFCVGGFESRVGCALGRFVSRVVCSLGRFMPWNILCLWSFLAQIVVVSSLGRV